MLSRIITLLGERGDLTVTELMQATGASRDALDGMLTTLQRRGLIDRQQLPEAGSCAGCDAGEAKPSPVVTLTAKTKPPAEPGAKG